MNWTTRLAAMAADTGFAARAVIISAKGPTPRAVGASMIVSPSHLDGRIGRPELMDDVISLARSMIRDRQAAGDGATWLRRRASFATGYVLGESAGGSVEVLIEAYGPGELRVFSGIGNTPHGNRVLARPLASGVPVAVIDEDPALVPAEWRRAVAMLAGEPGRALALTANDLAVVERLAPKLTPFHVYGTGQVARALVSLLAGLPFEVVWHDRSPAHFPQTLPMGVRLGQAGTPAAAAAAAPRGSFHAVMTSDHAQDLEVCRVLARIGNFGFLGVIGARLKQERLVARLEAEGVARETLARIACPIGLPGIRGKDPAVIAVSIAAQALLVLQAR